MSVYESVTFPARLSADDIKIYPQLRKTMMTGSLFLDKREELFLKSTSPLNAITEQLFYELASALDQTEHVLPLRLYITAKHEIHERFADLLHAGTVLEFLVHHLDYDLHDEFGVVPKVIFSEHVCERLLEAGIVEEHALIPGALSITNYYYGLVKRKVVEPTLKQLGFDHPGPIMSRLLHLLDSVIIATPYLAHAENGMRQEIWDNVRQETDLQTLVQLYLLDFLFEARDRWHPDNLLWDRDGTNLVLIDNLNAPFDEVRSPEQRSFDYKRTAGYMIGHKGQPILNNLLSLIIDKCGEYGFVKQNGGAVTITERELERFGCDIFIRVPSGFHSRVMGYLNNLAHAGFLEILEDMAGFSNQRLADWQDPTEYSEISIYKRRVSSVTDAIKHVLKVLDQRGHLVLKDIVYPYERSSARNMRLYQDAGAIGFLTGEA